MSSLGSCKKDRKGGVIKYYLSYVDSLVKPNSSLGNDLLLEEDSLYTQFGDYITSITPSIFIANMNLARYHDTFSWQYTDGIMLEFFDGNLPYNDPLRIADFSGNNIVSLTPIIYGGQTHEGIFDKPEIVFPSFYFATNYFYQHFDIPAEYDQVLIRQFYTPNPLFNNQDSMFRVDRKIFTKHRALTRPLFALGTSGSVDMFVFGKTDSSYLIHEDNPSAPISWDNPLGGSRSIARSNQFSPLRIITPTEGQTLTLTTNIGFKTNNLIQIYAGSDNIPYTEDDVFVYAPRFWNRLSVSVTSN